MIFPALSVARNCLRLETVPLTILGTKRGLLCNFPKKFMGRSGTDFQLLLILNLQNFLRQSFKKYVNYFLKFRFSITF